MCSRVYCWLCIRELIHCSAESLESQPDNIFKSKTIYRSKIILWENICIHVFSKYLYGIKIERDGEEVHFWDLIRIWVMVMAMMWHEFWSFSLNSFDSLLKIVKQVWPGLAKFSEAIVSCPLHNLLSLISRRVDVYCWWFLDLGYSAQNYWIAQP